MKILFTTFVHWPGVVTCLSNLKSLIEETFPEHECSLLNFDTDNSVYNIIKQNSSSPPDILVVGGWDYKTKAIVQNAKNKTTVVSMWCSPLTQSDLGGEIPRFFEVLDNIKANNIDYLALPLESDYKLYSELGESVIYLPVYMDFKELDSNKVEIKKEEIVVDMFCAPCQRKNLFAQINSLSLFKNKVQLRTNYSSGVYLDSVIKMMPNFINSKWMDRKTYLKKIQESSFAMQASLSESFNYVAAEHMYYGVPVVISNVVPYSHDKRIKDLVVKNPQDMYEIKNIIEKLIDTSFIDKISPVCKSVIEEQNSINKKEIIKSYKNLMEHFE